jgi:hydroxypyruvate isomerase
MDYRRLLAIVKKAGYRGYIGIEWEPEGPGKQLTPSEGIQMTKALLEKRWRI